MYKQNRLRRRKDFTRTYKRGKSIADKYLVIVFRKTKSTDSRIGISVSKKFGKAVSRNRIKRRIKEITRNNLDIIKPGYDIIFIVRKSSAKIDFIKIKNSVNNLLKRAGLIKK